MKKTIWTTDHRTLEHYREMSSMPFSVDLMRAYWQGSPWRALRVLFPGVDTLSCKGFTHITRLMERRACLPP